MIQFKLLGQSFPRPSVFIPRTNFIFIGFLQETRPTSYYFIFLAFCTAHIKLPGSESDRKRYSAQIEAKINTHKEKAVTLLNSILWENFIYPSNWRRKEQECRSGSKVCHFVAHHSYKCDLQTDSTAVTGLNPDYISQITAVVLRVTADMRLATAYKMQDTHYVIKYVGF